MERAPGRTTPALPQLVAWRLFGQILPLVAVALAAFLITRQLVEDDSPATAPTAVAGDHRERLAANIAFFETRVVETNDHVSYNRLTGLYLQRLRETSDVSDIARAEASALRSLEVLPGDYAGLVNLAMVRLAAHDFAAADEIAARAVQLRPGKDDAYAVLGDAQLALGKYEEAADAYRTYLERAPGFAAFSRQAAIAEARGSTAVAEQFWQAAIDADREGVPENSAWARVQLGHLYFNEGRLGEAREQFETALRVFPGYSHAEAGLGRVEGARGNLGRAIAAYQRATATVPNPGYVAALGDLLQTAGRPEEAARQFALVSAIESLYAANGVRDDLDLILFAVDHGADPGASLERARAAYESRPSIAAADTYAWALYRADRFSEARLRAEEALRLGTRDPLMLYHAGAIAAAQGDTPAARRWLGQALDMNRRFHPLHAPAAERLLASLPGGDR